MAVNEHLVQPHLLPRENHKKLGINTDLRINPNSILNSNIDLTGFYGDGIKVSTFLPFQNKPNNAQ